MKLSLHYPRQDLTPSQFKLVIDDMVTDLESAGVYQIERAANAWRKSSERFFPTSGQLLKLLDEMREESVAAARGAERFRALPVPAGKHPRELKPWRDILRENGRIVPPDSSKTAQALDLMQEGKPRVAHSRVLEPRQRGSIATISDALRNRLGIDPPQQEPAQ